MCSIHEQGHYIPCNEHVPGVRQAWCTWPSYFTSYMNVGNGTPLSFHLFIHNVVAAIFDWQNSCSHQCVAVWIASTACAVRAPDFLLLSHCVQWTRLSHWSLTSRTAMAVVCVWEVHQSLSIEKSTAKVQHFSPVTLLTASPNVPCPSSCCPKKKGVSPMPSTASWSCLIELDKSYLTPEMG